MEIIPNNKTLNYWFLKGMLILNTEHRQPFPFLALREKYLQWMTPLRLLKVTAKIQIRLTSKNVSSEKYLKIEQQF